MLLRPYWRSQAATLPCLTGPTSLALLVPLLVRRLTDEAFPARDLGAMLALVAGMAAVDLASAALTLATGVLFARASGAILRASPTWPAFPSASSYGSRSGSSRRHPRRTPCPPRRVPAAVQRGARRLPAGPPGRERPRGERRGAASVPPTRSYFDLTTKWVRRLACQEASPLPGTNGRSLPNETVSKRSGATPFSTRNFLVASARF